MSLAHNLIDSLTFELVNALASLPEEERIDALNGIRAKLHDVSPMRHEPIDLVLWVPSETVKANDYNPNAVAPPEMRLLIRSIEQDGYTQPVVTFEEESGRTVVDGFHRTRVAKESPKIRTRCRGRVPVTTVRPEREGESERIAATIRHNRARGVHGVMPMTEIVARLASAGVPDEDIAKDLGMDADEVLRFKQVKGLPSLFKDRNYSRAWE